LLLDLVRLLGGGCEVLRCEIEVRVVDCRLERAGHEDGTLLHGSILVTHDAASNHPATARASIAVAFRCARTSAAISFIKERLCSVVRPDRPAAAATRRTTSSACRSASRTVRSAMPRRMAVSEILI